MNTSVGENHHNQLMNTIYRDHYKNVYYQALSFVKNRETALDLTQDIFLKVFEQFGSFKGQSLLSTWLYAITKNHCLEYLRKRKLFLSEITENEYQIAVSEYDFDEQTDQENRNRWIDKTLEDTCDPDSEIVYMKHRLNLSVKAIQEHLNLSESAVKMRLQRARKRIASSYYSSVHAA